MMKHRILKRFAKRLLHYMGYTKIEEEQQLVVAGRKFRIDIVGYKPNGNISLLVEVGAIDKSKVKFLKKYYQVITIPYSETIELKEIYDGSNEISRCIIEGCIATITTKDYWCCLDHKKEFINNYSKLDFEGVWDSWNNLQVGKKV